MSRTIRLRGEPPLDQETVVVRGGEHSLSDEILERTAERSLEIFGLWALSVFLAPNADIEALSREVAAIRRRRVVRTATCGALRGAGFPVLDTTRHPLHFSVVLAELSTPTFDRLRVCFSEPLVNHGFRP